MLTVEFIVLMIICRSIYYCYYTVIYNLLNRTNLSVFFSIFFRNWNYTDVYLQFFVQHDDILKILPSTVNIVPGNSTYPVEIQATGAGNSDVTSNATDDRIK